MKKTNKFTFTRLTALTCSLISLILMLMPAAFAVDSDKCEHNFTTVSTVEATYGEDGYEIKQCTLCGKTEKTVIHNLTIEYRIDPTCYKDGLIQHCCTNCEYEIDVAVIPKLEHIWIYDNIKSTDSTCTEEGDDVYYCEICFEEKHVPVPKKEHNPSEYTYTDEEATCIKPGLISYHCTVCDTPIDATVIPPTGICESFYVEYIERPTAAKEGLAKYTCEECGKSFYETLDRTKPGETTLVNIKNTVNGVKIEWNEVYGADKYTVYRKAQGEKDWTSIAKVKGTVTKYTDKNVASGTKYTYTVKASNVSGYGGFDKKGISIKYIASPTVKATNKNGYVKLSWKKTPGAKNYNVYRKAGSETKWTKIASVKDGAALSYKDKNVKSGAKYTYTVKACNGSTASSTVSVKNVYLAQPKVTLSNGKSIITVKWNNVKGAKGYYIYRKAGNETKWTKIADVKDGTTLSYKDKNVKSGTKYTYTVKAYNGSNVSSTCSGVSIKYISPAKLISASASKAGTVLKWNKVSGADSYCIYRKTGSGSFKKLSTVDGGSTHTFTDKTAKKGTSYTYCVRACNGNSMGTYANMLTVKAK